MIDTISFLLSLLLSACRLSGFLFQEVLTLVVGLKGLFGSEAPHWLAGFFFPLSARKATNPPSCIIAHLFYINLVVLLKLILSEHLKK